MNGINRISYLGRYFRGLICLWMIAVVVSSFFLGKPSYSQALSKWRSEVFPVRQIYRLSSLFGEARGDHFHTGVDFAGIQRVYPIAKGDVIFVKDTAHNPTEPILGYGNVVILEHANNIRSYYYHLETGSIDRRLREVHMDTPLAMSGNTGRSMGAHLHFAIEDVSVNRFINPLHYLPILDDKTKPKIHTILFKINDKLYNLNQRRYFDHRVHPTVFVLASDLKPYYGSNVPINIYTGCGIHRIALDVDDKRIAEYEFHQLTIRRGHLLVNDQYTFTDIYGFKQNYKFGQFIPIRRQHTFKVTCYDFSGNKTTYSRTVFFLPTQPTPRKF